MNDLPSISSALPDMVNSYILIREERLALDRKANELKENEELLKKAVIAKMQEEKSTAFGASNGTVKLKITTEPVALDWISLWGHIKETGDFSLLHKRISTEAVKERWEAGQVVPGVGQQPVARLSVSKA